MSTRYVMRILGDTRAPDDDNPHLERWVVELDCEQRGVVTTEHPGEARTWSSRQAVRDYWLRECPPGKPWDCWESGVPGDGPNQPLIRYIVMIETLHEAEQVAADAPPRARWERRAYR